MTIRSKFGFLFVAFIAILIGRRFLFSPPEAKPIEIEENGWFGAGSSRPDDEKINAFKIAVPDTVLEVAEYWTTKYDWRKHEAIINSFPQFTTQIEGLKVHFIHSKASKDYKKVYPLLVVHGWPGNVFEFYKFIPILNDPKVLCEINQNLNDQKYGINVDFAFDVIAPSIPGYGWSESPKKTGFSPVVAARVFRKLMLRLDIPKFYLQGGDWGSLVTRLIAVIYPENALGLHLNMIGTGLPDLSPTSLYYTIIGSLAPSWVFSNPHYHNYSFFSDFVDFIKEMGYMHIQGSKPDTVGTALNDSPIGLAAYILEKFSTWTNYDNRRLPDGGLTRKFTLDELLTIVTIYWVNGNIVASQRFYRESFLDARGSVLGKTYVTVPTAHAHFLNEMFDNTPPELYVSKVNLIHRADIPNGGHFAAFEEPHALANDVFTFVKKFN